MRLLGKPKLNSRLVRLAYRFFDVEASGETAPPDVRMIEYSFVIGKLGSVEKGRVLDVGCTARLNYLPAALTSLGWEVYGIDTREFKFEHANFRFICEDVRHTTFPDSFFDYVYAVSTLEHIGLRGRYGVTTDDREGDTKTVKEIGRILRPEGTFLVTLPYGRERKVNRPFAKIYDKTELSELFSDWIVKDEIYYIQNRDKYWLAIPEQQASEVVEGVTALLELSPTK